MGRTLESGCPGELLNQDTFFVGHLKGVKVYLHAVVDTRWLPSYAFDSLHVLPDFKQQPESTLAILHNEALPFYSGEEP